MIIIGEKLNSSIPKTLEAINNCDEKYLIDLIKKQEENGACYLDINTAICAENELSKILWLIELAMKNSSCGIMVDSPSPFIIKEAVKIIKDRDIIINSVTLTDRIDELLPVVKETGAGVVCLPIDNIKMPETVEERVDKARLLIEKITKFGIDESKIYIDILAETLSVDNKNAMIAINTIKETKRLFPKVKTICGLSNVSFGLPKRTNINIAFMTLAIANGLDSAIMDNTMPAMKSALLAALAVTGKDEYCLDYVAFATGMDKVN